MPIDFSIYSFLLIPFSAAIAALVLGSYINAVIPAISARFAAEACLVIFYISNLLGLKFMGKVQNILVYSLIGGLLLFTACSLLNANQPFLDFSNS